MNLEATIYPLLGPLVGGRCESDIAPQTVAFPFIVYQQVGGSAIDYVEGKVPDKDNARVQVTIWATTRKEAAQLSRAARIALVEGDAQAKTMGAAVSLYDAAVSLHGSRQDFSVWYTP